MQKRPGWQNHGDAQETAWVDVDEDTKMQELVDYIKTQKRLGVPETEIVKALKKAGYADVEIDQHMGQAKKTLKKLSVETKHLVFMNAAIVILLVVAYGYLSYDFHTKLAQSEADLAAARIEIETLLAKQELTVQDEMARSESRIGEEMSGLRNEMTEQDRLIRSSITTIDQQSRQRDATLSGSIQLAKNETNTGLSRLSGQITEVEEKQVDFSKIVPDVIRSVVTIGMEDKGLFEMSGTGAIISTNGQIVTNYHVIDDLTNIRVRTSDSKVHTAQLIGYDDSWDVAVLRIDNTANYPRLRWANASSIYVGQPVIAIGHPQGLEESVTQGIISNSYRYIPGVDVPFLQTDVAVNEGNSGGPLLDKDGDIVGVMARKYTGNGVEGLGFAIKSSDAQQAVARILISG